MKAVKLLLIILIIQSVCLLSYSQNKHSEYTRQDTLRGSITPEREWWDLNYYHLDIKVNINKKSISGYNLIRYKVLKEHQVIQIDLQTPLNITKVIQNKKELSFKKDGNAWFITLNQEQKIGDYNEIKVYYEGVPKESNFAPWDGGITWVKDSKGIDFIASSCQGDGASLWWPCKDHMYDEPDSMKISVNVPKHLVNVSNGKLISIDNHKNDTKTFHWFVSNPINNYGVNINIGDYVNFNEIFIGEKGELECSYYVLRENLKKAKKQFKQVKLMLEAFEHWFGPYPFYEDSYKLVEVPYLGMEHQSSVTYGNNYKNGYQGTDLSNTGRGLKFDFIIIHESGHEWFANSITYKDMADMWIHESFTAYSENLYLDYHFGKEAAEDYTIGTRLRIKNDIPIIGPYDVNKAGSGDMYYKGANMLLSIREMVDDDEKWRKILRGINEQFFHQTVTSKDIEGYLIKETGLDLQPFFNQYLRDIRIPTFEYQILNNELHYRWTNCFPDFNMPVKVWIDDEEIWLNPITEFKILKNVHDNKILKVDRSFYAASLNLQGN
jgi:aminopeptidase N